MCEFRNLTRVNGQLSFICDPSGGTVQENPNWRYKVGRGLVRLLVFRRVMIIRPRYRCVY